MAYIGRDISSVSDRVVLDNITASATATYNLLLNSVAFVPSSAESLTVSLNGVIQKPQSSYTVSGSTIVFASALTSSDSIDFILAERAITLTTVGSGSVGTSQLVDSAVTNAKITDGTIANAKLANSSITLNGSAVSLGGSATIGGGKIGQVLQVTHSSDISTTSTSFVDTGISLAITPSATSSKILVMTDILAYTAGSNQGNHMFTKILRGSTDLAQRRVQSYDQGGNGVEYGSNISHMYLDSPSTTSETTYKIQYRMGTGSTARIHHGNGKTGSLTLLEVLA